MKDAVSPLRKYATPRYPTAGAIGKADLSRVPARWKGLHALASTIGAAALGLKTLALEAGDVPMAPSHPVEAVPDAKAPREAETKAPVTDVCPLPTEAIAGDGEGAFGCVAMNPPVILSEGDALEIIEREFKKRGIELVDAPELDGVEAPASKLEREQENANLVVNRIRSRRAGLGMPRKKRNWVFDLGTRDGSIMIEYISSWDDDIWMRDPWAGSSVSTSQPRVAAELAVDGFGKRTEGKPVNVGVFYDPLVCVSDEECKKFEEVLSKTGGWKKYSELRDKRGRELSEARLVAQIEYFFDYLAKKGKFPAKAPESVDIKQ